MAVASEDRETVSMWRLFFRMGGWILALPLLMFVGTTLASHHEQRLAWEFESDGVTTTGRVTDSYTTTSTDSDGRTTTTYWLELAFEADGKAVTVKDSLSRSRWEAARESGQTTLAYLPRNPQIIDLPPGSRATGARVALIMASVSGVALLVGFWIIGGWTVSAVAARRRGQKLRATVKEIYRSSVKVNKKSRYRLRWVDEQGGEGYSLLYRHGDLQGFAPGSEITVYVFQGRGWWLGDIGRPAFRQTVERQT